MGKTESVAVRVDPDDLRTFCERVFVEAGLSEADAATVADTLVDANLRGIDTHGVVRLQPYVERIEKGGINPDPDVTVERTAPGAALVDADGGPGQVGTAKATEAAMEQASEAGCAFVGVRNSNHFGTASYYTNMAAETGFIGISMTHAGPNVVPFGGADPYFGTNPISFALPTDLGFPITLDMATSVTAKGDVILAQEEGEEIPPEWAVDESGEPITDPDEFHALQPMAGPKGYGLGFMIDAFCGVLMDTVFGKDVPTMYHDMTTPAELGHVVAAVDVDAFTDTDAFKDRLGTMVSELKDTRTSGDIDEVLVPGEPEAQTRDARLQEGVPLGEGVKENLSELGDSYGVPFEW